MFSDTIPSPRLCCATYTYEVVKHCRYGKLVDGEFRCGCMKRCDECNYRHKRPMWPEEYHARLFELGLLLEDGEVPSVHGNTGMRQEPPLKLKKETVGKSNKRKDAHNMKGKKKGSRALTVKK